MNVGTIMIIMQANESQNREERLLCHVSMVAKLLEDNKPKKTLKNVYSHHFKIHQSHAIMKAIIF